MKMITAPALLQEKKSFPLPSPSSLPPLVSLLSGYGEVLEKEHHLLEITRQESQNADDGTRARLNRILEHHNSLLIAASGLIARRLSQLPHPDRFLHWPHPGSVGKETNETQPFASEHELLAHLIALHTALIQDLQALIEKSFLQGDSIRLLSEASASHEEMAWMLYAILREESATAPDGNQGTYDPFAAGRSWEDDGGAAGQAGPLSER